MDLDSLTEFGDIFEKYSGEVGEGLKLYKKMKKLVNSDKEIEFTEEEKEVQEERLKEKKRIEKLFSVLIKKINGEKNKEKKAELMQNLVENFGTYMKMLKAREDKEVSNKSKGIDWSKVGDGALIVLEHGLPIILRLLKKNKEKKIKN